MANRAAQPFEEVVHHRMRVNVHYWFHVCFCLRSAGPDPGDIVLGTLDELFEVWTTATLAQHAKPMVLLDTEGFYQPMLAWLSQLSAAGFIRPSGLELLAVTAAVPAAVDLLEERIGDTGLRQASPAQPPSAGNGGA